MLDHLNEEAWTELNRVQSCKQRSGVGGRGDRLLSPVSSPSLVTLEFSLRPFKIIDGEHTNPRMKLERSATSHHKSLCVRDEINTG